jgi:hypothetical protein
MTWVGMLRELCGPPVRRIMFVPKRDRAWTLRRLALPIYGEGVWIGHNYSPPMCFEKQSKMRLLHPTWRCSCHGCSEK